jgi:murein DD-endopeptidase MepM/ murein hydrolase activator NlpD
MAKRVRAPTGRLRLPPLLAGNSLVSWSKEAGRVAETNGMNAGRTIQGALGHLRRIALALLVAAPVLLSASCGQISGVHKEIVTFRQAAAAASPTPSNNGENSFPIPTIRYTVVTITKTKKVIGGGGPFYICPVQGKGFFSDDFGAPRYGGGFHLHQGNDVFAPLGTPIVAPFDGTATASPNSLGGLAVKVYGRQGYVYNAHLVEYEKLGAVKAGTVIGYVGNTGDALGGPTHDHFEWHPGGGPAVDPYPFLKSVC